ncbi:hypothetical protein NE619_07755 [Anaerovorax odorimutans]|uniref:Uncharacterized protein n=1 Tax=Anaerovorax odorimutans TaxID=109327 RepID=A0ABT1RN59_9FIRM|nr:hypothetical protein [Anaerovorax odorimutans]MCQ4636621.1 hypothetical protein [Anaerovorax odorimutans]
MKRKRAVRVFCILAVMMLVGSQLAVSAFAGTAKVKKVDYKEPSKDVKATVEVIPTEGYFKGIKKIIAKYNIGNNAEGDQVIELSNIVKAIDEFIAEKGANYATQPGDKYPVEVVITNSSGHDYQYKDGSFLLSTADTSQRDNLTAVTGFDGQQIPFDFTGALSPTKPLQDLFGVTRDLDITINMVCNIYDVLKAKGFTGDQALTDYIKDYYSKENSYKIESLDQLTLAQKLDLQKTMRNSQSTVTKTQLDELQKQYPKIMDHALAKQKSDGTYEVQIKWPENELAAMSYNFFYDSLLSLAFGKDAETLKGTPKTTSLEMAVADYMSNKGGIWSSANEYFKSIASGEKQLSAGQDSELTFNYLTALDGENTPNTYQLYAFSWYNTITLEQTDVEQYYYDGDISITKNVTENGKPYQVNTTFYAALFDDEACTTLTKDSDGKPIIIPLELKGQDSVTVTTDKTIPRGTFYVAETDKDGNVVKSTDQLTVTISSPSITVTEEATAAVTITNDYKDYEGYYRENGDNPVTTTTETSSTTTDVTAEKPEAVQTGDDSTMAPYIAALILAAAAAAAVAVTGKRKRITKK